MISTALIAGLAAFTLWHGLARKQPPGIRSLVQALPGPVRFFVACPWCAGAWIAATLTVALSWPDLDPVTTTITALAAATIPGLLDAHTPDDGSVS